MESKKGRWQIESGVEREPGNSCREEGIRESVGETKEVRQGLKRPFFKKMNKILFFVSTVTGKLESWRQLVQGPREFNHLVQFT